MFRSRPGVARRYPAGMARLSEMHSNTAPYPRFRRYNRTPMMRHRPPPVVEQSSFLGTFLSMLTALFCLQSNQTARRPVNRPAAAVGRVGDISLPGEYSGAAAGEGLGADIGGVPESIAAENAGEISGSGAAAAAAESGGSSGAESGGGCGGGGSGCSGGGGGD